VASLAGVTQRTPTAADTRQEPLITIDAPARSGIDADGGWTPAFEGQRPAFQPGNTAAEVHGSDERAPNPASNREP
jgi:hypothetical protein